MRYDPIKDIFAKFIRKSVLLRWIFYKILDIVFLRSWYIRRELKRILKNRRGKKTRILDAGSGFGQYSYFISRKFPNTEILAVDIKEEYLKDCREFFIRKNLMNVDFQNIDLTKMNFENAFDLILCVDVMEHIDDDVKVLQNFYCSLRNDGYLIINTPSVFGGSDVHNQNDESFISEHFRTGYSKEELFDKLSWAGFRNNLGFYTYGFYGDIAWRILIKYPMILLNLNKWFLILLPLYYVLTLPLSLIMMFIDTKSKIDKGTGLITISLKKIDPNFYENKKA